jgi:hypothetical protein
MAQAKAAADIGADETDFLERQPKTFRQHRARRVDAPITGNQRVGLRHPVVSGDAGPRA